MNNWRAIGYIFLGFGTVLLGYAVIAFLALTSLSTSPLITTAALVANTPWFILAALAYVVGIVGYFAGKEDNIKRGIEQPVKPVNPVKPAKRRSSRYTDPIWAVTVGGATFLVLLALHLGLGFRNNMTYILGVPSPIFVSTVSGVIVGIFTLVIVYFLNQH